MQNGNITMASEFRENVRIRLVSYLGPSLLLGGYREILMNMVERDFSPFAYLVPPVEDAYQVLRVTDANPWAGTFSLCLDDDPDIRLFWNGGQQVNLDDTVQNDMMARGPYDDQFRVEFVKDGQWFTLHPVTQPLVADVDHSITDTNAWPRILFWTPNGGDNQVWRAEVVPN